MAIADAAARMLEHQGTRDYASARRKAGALFGVTDEKSLPRNDEIESALRVRLELFHASTHAEALRRLREAAVAAMDFFAGFEPRLVGPVLDGSADRHSSVCLHLFEDGELRLVDRITSAGIEFDRGERRVRYADGAERSVSLFRFDADGLPFEVLLFAHDGLREAPLDPVHRRPQKRASRAAVLRLL